MNNKFEYFLNAIHYSMWRFGHDPKKPVEKRMGRSFSFIVNHFFSEKMRDKYYKRLNMERKNIEWVFDNKKSGFYVLRAHHFFGFFCAAYPGVISSVMAGYIIKMGLDGLNRLLLILAIAIPVIIGTIPADKAVFNNDRYLEYYKIFEKKDARWHRKWHWIMIAFCACSVVSIVASIFIAFTIAMS